MKQGLRILVVEDEAMIAMMIEEHLEILGYELFARAASVAEAMTAIEAMGEGDDLSAALLDCRLGGERSWPVARALTERGIPFVFMTGAPDDDVPADLEDKERLAKPFTLSFLETALARLTGADALTRNAMK